MKECSIYSNQNPTWEPLLHPEVSRANISHLMNFGNGLTPWDLIWKTEITLVLEYPLVSLTYKMICSVITFLKIFKTLKRKLKKKILFLSMPCTILENLFHYKWLYILPLKFWKQLDRLNIINFMNWWETPLYFSFPLSILILINTLIKIGDMMLTTIFLWLEKTDILLQIVMFFLVVLIWIEITIFNLLQMNKEVLRIHVRKIIAVNILSLNQKPKI